MISFFKTYAVYVKPGDASPLETAVFVKEGFSIMVYLFSIFWAVYHRVWSLVIFILIFYMSADILLNTGIIDIKFRMIMELGFVVWISFTANDWRGKSLMQTGYVLLDVVQARSLDEARQRLFDKYLSIYPPVVRANEATV